MIAAGDGSVICQAATMVARRKPVGLAIYVVSCAQENISSARSDIFRPSQNIPPLTGLDAIDPYILKRASSIGPHWSAPLVNYTLACLNFILRDKDAQIVLYRKPGGNLIISKTILLEIRNELKTLRKIKSRMKMEQFLNGLNRRYHWPENATN